jgi:hypothetical protein
MTKMFLARALGTKMLVRVAFAVVSLAGMAHARSTHVMGTPCPARAPSEDAGNGHRTESLP